jgi:hypothetical protein
MGGTASVPFHFSPRTRIEDQSDGTGTFPPKARVLFLGGQLGDLTLPRITLPRIRFALTGPCTWEPKTQVSCTSHTTTGPCDRSSSFQRGKRLFQFNLQELQGGFSSYDGRLQRKIGHATIFQAYKSYPGRPLAVEIKKSVGFQILQSYLSMEVLSHIP